MTEEQNVEEVTGQKPEPEPKSQTEPTEDFMALLEAAKAEGRREAEETYKGYQRVVSAREKENEDLKRRLEAKPVETLGAGFSRQILELIENGDYDKAKNLIAIQEQESTKSAALQRQKAITEGHRQRIREEIVAAGHSSNDEIFEDVFDAIDLADALDGKFDRADRKLARVLKANPKKVEATESDVKEQARRLLEEKGLLKTETGRPSASEGNYAQIRDRYIADPNNVKNRETYLNARRDRGL